MSTPSLIEKQRAKIPSRWVPDIASWAPARRNTWLLAGVAVCFGLYELVAIGLRYPYTTDEAIYLSQLNPQVPDYGWAAWRAWGMPVVAAPVALTDAPLTIVRLYFVFLASAGVFLAFRPWLAVSRRPVAPIAAALFASTSTAVYNGSLALPNYYSALGAIAATGYFMACRRGTDDYRRSLTGLTVAVAFAALVRPSDSLWLVLPLVLAWLGLPAWRRPAIGGAMVVGQVVGWAPWLVESFFRFGGPFTRLDLSSASLGGTHLYPDLAMVRLYVRLWSTGNPMAVSLNVPPEYRGGSATLATVHLAPIGAVAVVWWIAVACLAAVGVLGAAVLSSRSEENSRSLVLIPLVVGVSVAFPYLFMMRYGQLRFLLPAVGLLAFPIAMGLLRLGALRRHPLRVLGPGLAVALALGLVVVQMTTARPYRHSVAISDASFSSVIRTLRDVGVSGPCAIVGDGPMNVSYQTGCAHLGRLGQPGIEEPATVASARARGETVAIVLRVAPPAGTFMDRWRPVNADVPGQRRSWFVYLAPA